MTRYLADVNVIFAILHPEHEHSHKANAWLARSATTQSVCICRVAQMGALRLLTKKIVMGEAILSGSDAWKFVSRLLDDDRFTFMREPDELSSAWQAICESLPRGSSAETDAYLAAFAIAKDLTMVTFDSGFTRFTGLNAEILR